MASFTVAVGADRRAGANSRPTGVPPTAPQVRRGRRTLGEASADSQRRVGSGELKVLTRYRRMPNDANRCSRLPTGLARPVRGLQLCAGRPSASPDCHGKEGVDGSSPSEGFRNRATARFSCFRSGWDDHFRALPSEKGSSLAADRRCAALLHLAAASRLESKVPTRYTPGREPPSSQRGLFTAVGRRSRPRNCPSRTYRSGTRRG
jgi:hypothetical protein